MQRLNGLLTARRLKVADHCPWALIGVFLAVHLGAGGVGAAAM